MSRQCLNYLCLIVVVGLVAAGTPTEEVTKQKDNVLVKFVSGKDLERTLKQYPHAVPLVRSVRPSTGVKPLSGGPQSRVLVQYLLGSRVSGDSLVSYASDENSWATQHDLRANFVYPVSGTGAIISFVRIDVNQSNNLGQAYVVSGGIGQRHIQIVVEAYNTYWFNYDLYIYGY